MSNFESNSLARPIELTVKELEAERDEIVWHLPHTD